MDSIPRFQEWRQRIGTQDAPVISVVDDDESLRRSLKNFLRSVGFRVETFASAEEFLTSAQRETTGCLVVSRWARSEEHTSELQSLTNLVCRLLLEKKKKTKKRIKEQKNRKKIISKKIYNV